MGQTNFKPVGGSGDYPEPKETIYKKPNELTVGEVIEGAYNGSQTNNFGTTYYVLTEDNVAVGIGAPGQLNKKFQMALEAGLERGQPIQIVYKGMDVIEKGQWAGTKAHQFDLLVAEKEG